MGKGSVGDVWLVRHGETEWSRSGRHTSVSDIALTDAGEAEARELRERLAVVDFELVLTSPRIRARRTAELAGYPGAEVVHELAEWHYGELEGLTSDQIRERHPDWSIWTHGGPDGESVADIEARTDRLVARLQGIHGPVLCFGHGHALRVLAVRWLAQPVEMGGALALDTASVSVLGREHERPALLRWNA